MWLWWLWRVVDEDWIPAIEATTFNHDTVTDTRNDSGKDVLVGCEGQNDHCNSVMMNMHIISPLRIIYKVHNNHNCNDCILCKFSCFGVIMEKVG